MKTAKEMFEELGYKIEVNNYCVVNYYKSSFYSETKDEFKHGLEITFYDDESWYIECQSRHCEPHINKELNKAILKQMKELGWLD